MAVDIQIQPALTVREVQNRARSIDMSLFPSVKRPLGEKFTYVYSLLAGFCEFANSDVSECSEEVQKYAQVVSDVVQDCFKTIGSYRDHLSNDLLKLRLKEKLDTVLFYPAKTDFEFIQDEQVIASLKEAVTGGKFTLYSLPQSPETVYGGRIDIDAESFSKLTAILSGYREKDDVVGSSFDFQGHVTTVEPGELRGKYEEVIGAHNQFFTGQPVDVEMTPIGLKIGNPQSGRLSKVVTVVVEVKGLNEYRESLGLGAMKFPPHISVFSQEIQRDRSLEEMGIMNFTNQPRNSLLFKLHECFLRYFNLESQ